MNSQFKFYNISLPNEILIDNWSPAYSARYILESIYQLLSMKEPEQDIDRLGSYEINMNFLTAVNNEEDNHFTKDILNNWTRNQSIGYLMDELIIIISKYMENIEHINAYNLFQKDKELYEKIARQWTYLYANGDKPKVIDLRKESCNDDDKDDHEEDGSKKIQLLQPERDSQSQGDNSSGCTCFIL